MQLQLEVIMSPGIPEGFREMKADETSRPGLDIYRNARGTWSVSMNAAKVGTWTTFARNKKYDLPIQNPNSGTRTARLRENVPNNSQGIPSNTRRASLRK